MGSKAIHAGVSWWYKGLGVTGDKGVMVIMLGAGRQRLDLVGAAVDKYAQQRRC